VPFFVFDETYGVAGAQPPEVLLQVLDDVWREAQPSPSGADGEGCGDDACAIAT
jgi:predicted DsbA family dithiol-disulfide isomerase